jgi:hypothetical protein
LIHVYDAFYLYTTRRYALCKQRRLLQWLSLSSFVFQSSPLLVASPAALRRSDTQKHIFAGVCWYWRAVLHGCLDYFPLVD